MEELGKLGSYVARISAVVRLEVDPCGIVSAVAKFYMTVASCISCRSGSADALVKYGELPYNLPEESDHAIRA
jgi:hypothetical protein